MTNRRRMPRVGSDRWLVSYADFTTLLLAFFMALYSVSDISPAKLAAAQNSLRAAFKTPEGFGELERRSYDDTEVVFLKAAA